jgi:protoporphyrinogen oxidase
MPQAGPMLDTVDAVVIGAGMAGLAAADTLVAGGFTVQLIEAAPVVGGLARSLPVGDEEVEAYYHHVFPQDREFRDLIDRLGLSDSLEWWRASTAVLDNGRLFSFDSVLDLLRFQPLPLRARIRLGLGSAVALIRGRGRRLDQMRVGEAGPRWFGIRGYAVLWQPLLEGKFGPFAHDVALAWLVGRMKQRANARRGGTGGRLGYLRGGLGALARRYEEEISAQGVRVSCGTPADSLVREGDRWRVRFGGREVSARAVVACLSGETLDDLTTLPDAYRQSIEAIPYRAVTCALLELDRPLGRCYWINLIQRTELSCLAVIEHTNFIPADRYGGRHLVYLTHYVEVGGRAWSASVEEIVDAAEGVLRAINPEFDRGWIQAGHVSRDRWAQPVPLAGGPMPGLSIETGMPGLFHASLAHIYPADRGVSLALKLGRRAGTRAGEWLTGTGSDPALHGS